MNRIWTCGTYEIESVFPSCTNNVWQRDRVSMKFECTHVIAFGAIAHTPLHISTYCGCVEEVGSRLEWLHPKTNSLYIHERCLDFPLDMHRSAPIFMYPTFLFFHTRHRRKRRCNTVRSQHGTLPCPPNTRPTGPISAVPLPFSTLEDRGMFLRIGPWRSCHQAKHHEVPSWAGVRQRFQNEECRRHGQLCQEINFIV